MSIFSAVKDFFQPAPQEVTVVWHENQMPFSEIRASDPDFDIYARPQALSAKFGQRDHEAPKEYEQRAAFRGIISTLVRLRASAIADAMCRAEVKRTTGPKEFEDVEDNHPWKTLLFNPSPNLSPYDFWFDNSSMRDMGKGGFSGVGRDSRSIPDSFYPIYPAFGEVNAVPNSLGAIDGYVYTNNGGATQDIDRRNMLWLRHRNPVTPYESASLLEQAAYNSDIALYQAIYGRDMTAEGNVPPAYASFKEDISPKQQAEYGRLLTKEYMSVGQKKKVLVMGAGGELKTLGINPNDLQYIEAANLNDHQIMRIFGFPPAMFEQSGVVANSEEVRKQWMQVIQFEVTQICSALSHQFKIMFDAEESNLVIIPPNVVPMNPVDMHRVREIKIRTGQASPNEFRLEDGVEEYAGGENYYLSAGLQPILDDSEEEVESV